MKTQDALKMSAFQSPQQRLVLTVLHASSAMLSSHRALLKPHGVTPQQFNILRILNGADGALSLADVASRMIDRNSNTSRLIDKLLAKGLVQRVTCPSDRRRVEITLTNEGQRTTKHLSLLMDETLSELADVWTNEQATQAADILDRWNMTQP